MKDNMITEHFCTGGNWDNEKKRFVCEHEPNQLQELHTQLEAWWWETNGTGTDHCIDCHQEIDHICTWHSARLDDLMTLIQPYIEQREKKHMLERAADKAIISQLQTLLKPTKPKGADNE